MPAILAAQAPPPEVRVSSRPYVAPSPYALRVETGLVDVGVVVRDPNGRAVPGLKQRDFQVLEDGKERVVTSFAVDMARARGKAVAAKRSAAGPESSAPAASNAASNAARPPRFVVLFVDDANTNTGDLTHAQIAARRFVKEALNPGDRVAIVTASSAETLELTADAARMVETIGRLKPHQRVPDSGLQPFPRITPYQAYLIASRFDDAALYAGRGIWVRGHGSAESRLENSDANQSRDSDRQGAGGADLGAGAHGFRKRAGCGGRRGGASGEGAGLADAGAGFVRFSGRDDGAATGTGSGPGTARGGGDRFAGCQRALLRGAGPAVRRAAHDDEDAGEHVCVRDQLGGQPVGGVGGAHGEVRGQHGRAVLPQQ
ncbi:hypothetical protein SBA6_1350011 [Candidatus Sulfopaludibacter sp. SbA6]|nr:hypothetical protein SBA6_1350011 [Candidatus Sulfopaludibacter sp. SbA6]